MRNIGQIVLVLFSISVAIYEKISDFEPFFTIELLVYTFIAWVIGLQYDRAKYYAKVARKSEDSYKHLVNSLPELIIIHRDFKILYINKTALRFYGGSNLEDVIGRSIFEFISPEYEERMKERLKQVEKGKNPLSDIEYMIKSSNGESSFMEASSMTILFGEQEAVLTVMRDISQKKEKTELLIQKSEKLALLGQMAAGIAHEIRNPLTTIKGFLQLFRTTSDASNFQYYDIVNSELERINTIVDEFLVLAKPSTATFIRQDIQVIIKEVVAFNNSQAIMNNVQVSVSVDDNLPSISCEKNQLKQVFLNLLKNSIEAMPNGGKIQIFVTDKEIDQISIRILDEGVGIPQERIHTLGEPFYTTKEKGTGLGLMICYKIIESHGGKLTIQSEEQVGTVVEITLPTATQSLLKPEV
jgi:PAS domain S-box-containing protein